MLMKSKSTDVFIGLNKSKHSDQAFNSLLKTYFGHNEFVNFDEMLMNDGLDLKLVKRISDMFN